MNRPSSPCSGRPPDPQQRGLAIVEPLIASVLIIIVMTSAASLLALFGRRSIFTAQQIAMQEAIDADVRQIKRFALQYTCCSGQCSTTPPSSFGRVGGVLQPCATNDWNDDRYYFPQVDLPTTATPFPGTTTPSEPLAVEQLCANNVTANANFLTPFKKSVDALVQPLNATRSSSIQANKTLRVTYVDAIQSREARVVHIRPVMANFCT
jgi:hypothetical protein